MKAKTKPKPPEIELHPDAWERFESAVDIVMRSPPKHRTKKKGEPEARPSPSAKRKRASTS